MSQALYRRYRPETFADVIGQAHVTDPLQQALRNDRAHHAYLFSGPRGCGKTTSARILARCLNCEQGPTPTPCGACESCIALGTGGPGSLDVIEIDAASHGGVDDARDLRERAFYAPASSRYKIYIIDEAHMVSREGFNALLKLVEEPPEHVKFIFATTEPEKVIATIRSRTHHYPFRLVPPGELLTYLGTLCERESVTVDPGVLQLVVRAGRGSVRDSLSVLDQLMAGAGEGGVTYPLAISLLGYTDAALLDDTIEAFAAVDAAAVFGIVDRVVEAGHDPRRFAEDLLERLRDLIIIEAVPDDAASILSEHPADELERMRQQAAHFGATQLSRAADIINAGLIEMRGATAPRLQLELMCARVLLPGADDSERGIHARLDRLERRLSIMGTPATAPAVPAAEAEGAAVRSTPPAARPAAPARPAATAPPEPAAAPEPAAVPEPATAPEPAERVAASEPIEPAAIEPVAEPAPEAPEAPAAEGAIDLTTVRRMWPDVLEVVKGLRRFTWTLLSHNAQVAALDGNRLTLAMVNAGARDSFAGGGSDEIVREALIQVLGVDWKVDAIVDPSASPAAAQGSGRTGGGAAGGAGVAPAVSTSGRAAATGRVTAPATPAPGAAGPASGATGEPASTYPAAPQDAEPSPDDEDVDDRDVSHQDLLARELGARVIGEYENS
ncbi:MAG: DNA polymerase III subunit gamma and tau [Nocardioides sp.]